MYRRRLLPSAACFEGIGLRGEPWQMQFGLTVHALCAAIKLLLREYTILIAQLEHQFRQGKLSLQKLFFYTVPSTRTLNALDALRLEANFKIGGALLNVLQRLSHSGMGIGDQRATAVYRFLLERAAVPTFEMLGRWLSRGEAEDQYDEFRLGCAQARREGGLNFNASFGRGILFATSRSCSFSARRARF